MRLFDRAMTFFGKESVSKPNEQSLLLPLGGGSIQESGVPAVQKEEGDESISPLNQLLPFDVAVIVYCLLDPKQLAGAQGRAALAAQYTHHLGFDESFLKSQTEAQEKFIGQQKSLERVLSYLLKYHPSLLGGDIQFRDIKLHALTLSNSAVDVAGCYTIDTTGADFLALQAIFKGGMYNARVFFRVAISSCVLMSFLFLSLFFSMKRNLLFCPVDELYFIGSSSGSGSSNEYAPAHMNCPDVGPRNGAWGCGDFLPVPDICLKEHNYCATASFANAAWVFLATSLDPYGNEGVAVSCSYSNQVGFMIGLVCFAVSAAILAGLYYKHCSETLPTPACLKDHWKNIQGFFAEDKASYTVPPSVIDPNADVERIAVVVG